MKKYFYKKLNPRLYSENILNEIALFKQLKDTERSIIARILYNRNIKGSKNIKNYLSDGQILSPFSLWDCLSASELILKHINNKSKVIIYGDYDADGICASAILWKYLFRTLKLDANVYIPSRYTEGYGLNAEAINEFIQKNIGLVITVDCGIRDAKFIAKLKENSIDVIVTDHHTIEGELPNCPVVHPNYPGHNYENATPSGAVVVWKFVQYLDNYLSKKRISNCGRYIMEEDVDLASLSLITDVMPITNENRAILKLGLKTIRSKPKSWIYALCSTANISTDSISTYELGYIIGPRINASGRVGDPYDSLKVLTTLDPNKALAIANKLNIDNEERQRLTEITLLEAKSCMENIENKIIIAHKDGWNEGIIGLVAGKIQKEYDLPTIILTGDKETGEIRASARSVSNFNITNFVSQFKDILIKYGGHDAAAGFSLEYKNIDKLKKRIRLYVKNKLANFVPLTKVYIDAKMEGRSISLEFAKALELFEPYANGNSKPIFKISGHIRNIHPIKETHTSIFIDNIKCIFWDSHISEFKEYRQGDRISVIGTISINSYNGDSNIVLFGEKIRHSPLKNFG